MCSWALMWFHLPWPVPVNHRCGIDLEPMCAVVSSVQIIHFSICLEYMSISCIVVRLRESIQRLWVTWWWRNPSRWGRLESSPHSTERMLVRHLFCNLHSVKLAHYEKMHIRIHLLSLQYKKKVTFLFDVSPFNVPHPRGNIQLGVGTISAVLTWKMSAMTCSLRPVATLQQ